MFIQGGEYSGVKLTQYSEVRGVHYSSRGQIKVQCWGGGTGDRL